jgi:hypothetical protein
VKSGSGTKCWRTFCFICPEITVPSTTDIHKLINKVRSIGLLLDKEPAKRAGVYRRKTKHNEGYARTHTTENTGMPCTKVGYLKIVSSKSDRYFNFGRKR